ncbi:hypothetical protein STANM309S_00205 [Streptomyces tanashiensis]
MVLDLVVIGLAITMGPLHNSAFILLLSSRSGVRKGLAFLLSWLANLVVVITLVLLLTGGQPPTRHSAPSTGAIAAKLAIGVALVLYGAHRRRRPPRPHGPPRWTARVDNASWVYSGRSRVGASALGTGRRGRRDRPRRGSLHPHRLARPDAGYCLLATLSLVVMEMYVVWAPASAHARLNALRSWLGGHQDKQLIVTLSLVVGLLADCPQHLRAGRLEGGGTRLPVRRAGGALFVRRDTGGSSGLPSWAPAGTQPTTGGALGSGTAVPCRIRGQRREVAMLRTLAPTTAPMAAPSIQPRPCPSPIQPTRAASTGLTLMNRPKAAAGTWRSVNRSTRYGTAEGEDAGGDGVSQGRDGRRVAQHDVEPDRQERQGGQQRGRRRCPGAPGTRLPTVRLSRMYDAQQTAPSRPEPMPT